jgi:hypothetical protein
MDKPRVWTLPPDAVRALASDLGHSDLNVEPQGRLWIFRCSCGYRSAGTTYARYAAASGIRHLEAAIKRWQAAGTPPIYDTPTEHTSESRTSRIA